MCVVGSLILCCVCAAPLPLSAMQTESTGRPAWSKIGLWVWWATLQHDKRFNSLPSSLLLLYPYSISLLRSSTTAWRSIHINIKNNNANKYKSMRHISSYALVASMLVRVETRGAMTIRTTFLIERRSSSRPWDGHYKSILLPADEEIMGSL
jgi:hypothetical protein